MSDLLPASATPLERALDAAGAARIAAIDVPIDMLWNPADCPLSLLPWLAWALSVDDWDTSWDESTQRAVVAAAIEIHRKKGTVAAVRAAITSLGHTGRLVEWWQTEPRGTPHTFSAEVEIADRGLDDAAYNAIDRQIVAVKPARSHYSLRMIGRSAASARIACAALSGEIAAIQPYQITEADAPLLVPRFGIGWAVHATVSVYPIQ